MSADIPEASKVLAQALIQTLNALEDLQASVDSIDVRTERLEEALREQVLDIPPWVNRNKERF